MLRDRRLIVEKMAPNLRLRRLLIQEYSTLLSTLFGSGDWFVTITFRDRHQDLSSGVQRFTQNIANAPQTDQAHEHFEGKVTRCVRDPRLDSWEPDSKYRREPGPPVRDAALREIEHWLLELGLEAAGRKRQEIIDRLADGLYGTERRKFLRQLSGKCLCCAVFNDPVCTAFYYEIRKKATSAIGWVIAEEFGRAGGRWHVHLIIRGVQHLRRKRWWKRAFVRFGRTKIEPIHE